MSKIKVQGVPRQFDLNELQVKQQKATKAYLETSQSLHRLYSNNHGDFFNQYAELVLEGYRPALHRLPDLQANDYTAYLLKPQSLLDSEVLELEQRVKQAYIQELERDHVEFEIKLVAQMVAADEAKEQKALETKKAKKLAEFKVIAANTFTPLLLPETERVAKV